MPDGVIQCGGSVTDTTLRATTGCRLEHFVKWYNAGVVCITAAYWTAEGANSTCPDSNAGFLADILNNTAGSSINVPVGSNYEYAYFYATNQSFTINLFGTPQATGERFSLMVSNYGPVTNLTLTFFSTSYYDVESGAAVS